MKKKSGQQTASVSFVEKELCFLHTEEKVYWCAMVQIASCQHLLHTTFLL